MLAAMLPELTRTGAAQRGTLRLPSASKLSVCLFCFVFLLVFRRVRVLIVCLLLCRRGYCHEHHHHAQQRRRLQRASFCLVLISLFTFNLVCRPASLFTRSTTPPAAPSPLTSPCPYASPSWGQLATRSYLRLGKRSLLSGSRHSQHARAASCEPPFKLRTQPSSA